MSKAEIKADPAKNAELIKLIKSITTYSSAKKFMEDADAERDDDFIFFKPVHAEHVHYDKFPKGKVF